MQNFRALGAPPPTTPHCEFLATRLSTAVSPKWTSWLYCVSVAETLYRNGQQSSFLVFLFTLIAFKRLVITRLRHRVVSRAGIFGSGSSLKLTKISGLNRA